MSGNNNSKLYTGRYVSLLLIIMLGIVGLAGRMVDLTVFNRDFLLRQGNARTLRIIETPAYRGMITDRNGEPLAISTPVESVWVNPQDFDATPELFKQFADRLQIPEALLKKRISDADDREFMYLKRGLGPEIAAQIKALGISGVYFQREFRRFYPEGEVTGHLLGFTNIDDQGQEGLELAYNEWLKGEFGKKRVLKDRMGHIVADVQSIKEPRPGHNLVLSIDRRIQFLAYRTLKAAVTKFSAASGSVIVLDAKTGEILAMVNQPSYNPNERNKIRDRSFRNRAVTDTFEPGSVMKAFTIATALASGEYKANTVVNTKPIVLEGKIYKDEQHAAPSRTVSEILQWSSNVGVTKIILSLAPDALWELLHKSGFGDRTSSGFPGESTGVLVKQTVRRPVVLATLAFGYGLSVTTLQLAHAYSIFANEGQLIPISLLRTNNTASGSQVLKSNIAHEMLTLLTEVVELGTGKSARVKGYKVAGKTGTARIAGKSGYQKNHHIASFVGIAPATAPRLVVAVVIKDPGGGKYYAAELSAPVFAEVMGGSLRILNVSPDNMG